MERSLFPQLEREAAEASETVDETLKALNRTTNYAHKIERIIEKTRAELKSMQSERKASYVQAQQEAILLTQLAHSKGQTAGRREGFPVSRSSAVALFIHCPKSLASSVAPPASRRPMPASAQLHRPISSSNEAFSWRS